MYYSSIFKEVPKMYFKVCKDNEIVDILKNIFYIKYQEKHDWLVLCDIKEAEAILSSDGTHGWHIEGLYNFPPDNHVYEITEISKTEYDKLKER